MAGSKNMSPGTTRPTYPLAAPNDGEMWSASTVLDDVVQKVLDHLGYLDQATEIGQRCMVAAGIPFGGWAVQDTPWFSYTDSGNAGSDLAFPLQVPHGKTLTQISVTLIGTGHSSLPANMPILKLYKSDHSVGGSESQIGSTATDSSATHTIFDAAHALSITGLTEVIDRTKYRYVVVLTGEHGTNSQAGLQCYMPIVTLT